MDNKTYEFSKNTLFKEIAKNNIPEEIKVIVNCIRIKGLKINHIANPQVDCNKKIMDGSYAVEFFCDLGEEIKKFLLVTILKNKWTNWKIEWWVRLDEIEFEQIKGNNFEKLKQTIETILVDIVEKANNQL